MGHFDNEKRPPRPTSAAYYYDSFSNGEVLENKKRGRLPAMGWNSWNAFGSNNTEELTRIMADRMVELGLDKLGYQYVVLDDGCYLPERVDGKLQNEPVKFPNDFKVLADYIHAKGLKFGMYNDIGTNLCAGAAVGTCGHETTDARSYVNWDVDFLKVDNCYYLWDNATFSDASNAKYVFGPIIRKVYIKKVLQAEFEDGTFECFTDNRPDPNKKIVFEKVFEFKKDFTEEEFLRETGDLGIGTYDGTGPEHTPIGEQSKELVLEIEAPESGEYDLFIKAMPGREVGCGSWLQVQVESELTSTAIPIYDDFIEKDPIQIHLHKGQNRIRLMNHRRQENTLLSYATFLAALNKAKPDHDIVLSICEWGKTQPQNWGYKVGASWRILNDITFQVGNDGDPGRGEWTSDYTPGVAVQYNKAVIMDEYTGLDKGWNDPDMLMIGMNGLDMTMCRTHMTMWCMMNAPLMLGLDLRRVEKGDDIWNIIANEDMIELNQDALGVQAKRVKVYQYNEAQQFKNRNCSDEIILPTGAMRENALTAATTYIRDNNRVDVLVKPLQDGSVAVSFINLSDERKCGKYELTVQDILAAIGHKFADGKVQAFARANRYQIINLWNDEMSCIFEKGIFIVECLEPHDQVTIKVTPLE